MSFWDALLTVVIIAAKSVLLLLALGYSVVIGTVGGIIGRRLSPAHAESARAS